MQPASRGAVLSDGETQHRKLAASNQDIDFERQWAALTEFDAMWEVLMRHETGRLVQLVIQRVVSLLTGDFKASFRMQETLGTESQSRTQRISDRSCLMSAVGPPEDHLPIPAGPPNEPLPPKE